MHSVGLVSFDIWETYTPIYIVDTNAYQGGGTYSTASLYHNLDHKIYKCQMIHWSVTYTLFTASVINIVKNNGILTTYPIYCVLWGTVHSSCQFSNWLWGITLQYELLTSHRPPLYHIILIDHLCHIHHLHVWNCRNFYNDMFHCIGKGDKNAVGNLVWLHH